MSKVVGIVIASIVSVALYHSPSFAQESSAVEKKTYNYGNWTKNRFSEVVTVKGDGKLIFLSGTGPEEEMEGEILHKDNFVEQCRHAYGKVKKMLAAHGATMDDIIKQNVFIVDVRNQPDYGKCRSEAFKGAALPASTAVYVSALGQPHMLFEIDIIAIARN